MNYKLIISNQFRAISIKDWEKNLKLIHLLRVGRKDLNRI